MSTAIKTFTLYQRPVFVFIKKKKFSARSFDMDEDYTRLWKEKKLSPFDIRSDYHAIPPVLYEAPITTNISLFLNN